MAREKQNSDAIHKCKYLDYFTLQYPSIDYIIVCTLHVQCTLYIIVQGGHKGDIDLLALHYKHTYLDGSMPFGYRLGSGIF